MVVKIKYCFYIKSLQYHNIWSILIYNSIQVGFTNIAVKN